MQSKLDLNKYSKEELEDIREQIWDELYERERKEFPYKEGDCFYEVASSNEGCGSRIARIDSINKSGVEVTIIAIDALKNANKFPSRYNYSSFISHYKKRIDPKIFEIYSENFKAISKIKNEFLKKIKELMYDETGTISGNASK